MGSSGKDISDDSDRYERLCKQYGEVEGALYSIHYDWLHEVHKKTTILTYEQYRKVVEINLLTRSIERKETELATLKKELIDLMNDIDDN